MPLEQRLTGIVQKEDPIRGIDARRCGAHRPMRENRSVIDVGLPISLRCRSLCAAVLAIATVCAGCATSGMSVPAGAASAPASAPAAPASASAAAGRPPSIVPTPAAQPPFATVIRDARRIEGLFTLWQKEDKVWIELTPDDFGRLLFLGPKISRGIGEAGLFGGTMIGRWPPWGRTQVVEFRRVQNLVQLVALNTEYVAAEGTPQAAAVKASYSPSLLGSTNIASLPEPDSKSVLIEANALFLTDMLAMGNALQRVYRQGYALDARNSAFVDVRARPDAVIFDTQIHFAAASIAVANNVPPGAPTPSVPGTVPDARSLFLGLHYSLSALPVSPMPARRADPRVGHFTTVVQDFGNDLDRSPRLRHVNRWRLQKSDPQAALSEPVKPITFWIDRTVPVAYRPAVKRGILEWNKAFERIGFSNAIVVKEQPDDADFDTLDIGVASVRWMTNASMSFVAYGPTQVDPRSGEILDADIVLESLASRSARAQRAQVLEARLGDDAAAMMKGLPSQLPDQARCAQADGAAEQLQYALDVLEARGELDPESPDVERFVQDSITETVMHEVGHALGLRHNFRSSRAFSERQLADASFTAAQGIAGSVMDYTPINLPRPGEPGGARHQLTLGPYDYWAIEYAYRPIPEAASPPPADGVESPGKAGSAQHAADATDAQEKAMLQQIAARSAEPELAYGTDEDAAFGIDPETLVFDLGNDEVAFAAKRIVIARDLIARQENRSLDAADDYGVLRRAVGFAMRDAARAAGILVRQIGGVRTLRDYPGSGRDPLSPVEPAIQRAALDVLAREILAPDAFAVSPALARRMAPDYFERAEAAAIGVPVATDFALAPVVVDLQRALLAQLMSDPVAVRITDNEQKVDVSQPPFRLSEVYERLMREVWGDIERRASQPLARRELQRDHVNRLASQLLRPDQLSRADARGLMRLQARALLPRLQAASRRPGADAATRAHLEDCVETLQQALSARLARGGF
jgi:Met-zincin/Domain of unknown function (DUF5117)